MGGSKLYILLFVVLIIPASSLAKGDNTLSGLNLQEFESNTNKEIVWQNNPFVKPASDVALSELKLTGIVYNSDEKAAIINEQVTAIGDKIGLNEVVEIERKFVILRNENGLFKLTFKGKK